MTIRPAHRRLIAATLLIGFAIGSSLFWNDWAIDWISLGTNLAVACLGMVALHYRWRSREGQRISADEAKEEFS